MVLLVVDPTGTVYVSSNQRVQVFEPKNAPTYRKDAPKAQIKFYLKRITTSPSLSAQQAAWNDLEKLARKLDLSDHKEVWNLLDKEILTDSPSEHVNEALNFFKKDVARG